MAEAARAPAQPVSRKHRAMQHPATRSVLELQRLAGNAAVAAVLAPQAGRVQRSAIEPQPTVQRMWGKLGKAIETLTRLNEVLPAHGISNKAITTADFPTIPGVTDERIDAAITQSNLRLYQGIPREEIVNELQAILATPPPLSIAFEDHGAKHFGGSDAVKKGGDQWAMEQGDARAMMEADIRRLEPLLRAHAKTGQDKTEYYYTARSSEKTVQWNNKPLTFGYIYTIQISYFLSRNAVTYHGYPDKDRVPQGLGYAKNAKLWVT